MDSIQRQPFRIAVLDLYDGVTNQGMRGIRETLQRFFKNQPTGISWDEFNVRQKMKSLIYPTIFIYLVAAQEVHSK